MFFYPRFLNSAYRIWSVLAVITIMLAVNAVPAQTPAKAGSPLKGFRLNATLGADSIDSRIERVFGPGTEIEAKSQVELYRIDYLSTDGKGNTVVLNGLVALPKDGAPNGLVVFNHGTISDRDRSPSRYKGKADSSESEMAILAFTSGGYAVALPDYLGLGDSKGFHPYPLARVNSRSAVDMIAPARRLAKQLNITIGSNLFVSGYSEGGAVAMWTARDLEGKNGSTYDLTASAPLSGPYDLSETVRKWLLADNTGKEGFIARLYLMSFMLQSFHENEGVKLTNYLKPAMALAVSQAFKVNRDDKLIITRLAIGAALMRANDRIENVLTPTFYKALKDRDLKDPVVRGLAQNDSYDWTPRVPMLLVNLAGDTIVDQGNTDVAFREMRKRSGPIVAHYVIRDPKLDHITAAAPAILQARWFFDGIIKE